MKIRTQIIASFLTLIIVPFATLALSIILYTFGILPVPSLAKIFAASENSKQIEAIVKSDVRIFDPGSATSLTKLIDELIGEYAAKAFKRVLILDEGKTVLYDSQKKIAGKVYDSTYNDSDPSTGFTSNIRVDGVTKGYIVFIPSMTDEDAMRVLILVPLLMTGIFVLAVAVTIVILTKTLTRGILQPLSELSRAVEAIGSGNLSQSISYRAENEFGVLFREFDSMRTRLVQSLEKQSAYEKSRKELIASITHDLKTPLTSINGYIEALQDGIAKDDAAKDRYLSIIYSKTTKLNTLIDDLFTYSKLELGEFQVSAKPTPSGEMLESILSHYELELGQSTSGIRLHVARPIADATLSVDERRIGQVIDNLMENAIRHAVSTITASTSIIESAGGRQYAIDLEDDGDGIPAGDMPFIFDHFYKADKSRGANPDGSGLGLAICRQLVEAHGGSIEVASSDGTMTLFRVILPICETDTQSPR